MRRGARTSSGMHDIRTLKTSAGLLKSPSLANACLDSCEHCSQESRQRPTRMRNRLPIGFRGRQEGFCGDG